MAALIATYGYAAVLIGTFLEGETILVLAGFAAHRGYLELPWVIVAAALGSIASDQIFFFLGRHKGTAWIERRPQWQDAVRRAFDLVARTETLLIVGFRFLYGLRTITPVVLGASGVRPVKFVSLNIVGAVVWAIAFGYLGYLTGAAAQAALGDVERVEMAIFALIAAVGTAVWLFRRWRRSR